MKWVLVVLIVLGSTLCAAMDCTVPENGMYITNNTRLCMSVYYLSKGLRINTNNITLDCAGSVLKGDFKGRGIWIEHSSGVIVKNCHVVNHIIGIYVRNSSNIFLSDNHLIRNFEGIRLVDVENSTILGNDVSVQKPFVSIESKNNYVKFTNKKISEQDCGQNFCNVEREVLESRKPPEPEKPKNWLKDWLRSMLG